MFANMESAHHEHFGIDINENVLDAIYGIILLKKHQPTNIILSTCFKPTRRSVIKMSI